ncbi:MAG: DUF748 domain-containing protein [Comamonadaceae bacterium]|nr:DUF748 domain-containing protein [Comamonadaceae bacterium]
MRIGEVTSRGGILSATRAADGSVDLLNPIEYRVARTGGSAEGVAPKEPGKPWIVTVNKLAIDGYTIRAEDRVPEDPAVFLAEKVESRGEKYFDGTKQHRKKISLSLVPNRGLISLAGSLSIDPMTLNLTTDAKEVLIGPFQLPHRYHELVRHGVAVVVDVAVGAVQTSAEKRMACRP